jgi:glycolate oxidase FAD binding subunit
MILAGSNVEEVRSALVSLSVKREAVSGFDLRAMPRVLEYTPEDMTVSVEAGITLAQLQQRLAEHKQWLPIDPPRGATLTIGALLAANKSGPRRFGFGTIREHLLGLKVVLADGRVVKAGGKVVKNVAGYDLCKLFVGNRGTLGVIVEATFKVLPQPESEVALQRTTNDLDELGALLRQINESPLTPVVLDLYGTSTAHSLVVGLAGSREDVEWQRERAQGLGLQDTTSFAYNESFSQSGEPPQMVSVLPSKAIETIKTLGAQSYVARAGNGVIYSRGGKPGSRAQLPVDLIHRVKETFDPNGVLPEMPW